MLCIPVVARFHRFRPIHPSLSKIFSSVPDAGYFLIMAYMGKLKLQCSACDIDQEGLMKCTNCLKACYCSTECQRSDWKRHKTFCHDAVDKTLKLAQRMKALHEMKKDNTGLGATYYWGNIPAVDLLNLSMNEGEEYSNSLALLLCGVGDPTASLPDVYTQQVSFVRKRHLSLHPGQNRSTSIYVIQR